MTDNSNGRFVPGDPRINRRGRPSRKGNLSAEQIRRQVSQIIEGNLDSLEDDIKTLDSLPRLQIIDRLLRHVLPAPLNIVDALTDADFEKLVVRIKKDFASYEEKN